MDLSATERHVLPDKIVLNVISAGGTDVKFSQGEILKGIVREVRPDGTVSLLINDKLTVAASDIKLIPGQQLYLLSERLKNGQTGLRVITEQEFALLENKNPTVVALLRHLGVAVSADTLLIARALLQHNLSATQQNILEISNTLSKIGGVTPRGIDMAIFALENNIPIDQNTLPSIYQFIASSDGNLTRLVQELTQFLSKMEIMVEYGHFSSVLPSPIVADDLFTSGADGTQVLAPDPNATITGNSNNSMISGSMSAGLTPQADGAALFAVTPTAAILIEQRGAISGMAVAAQIATAMPEMSNSAHDSANNPPVSAGLIQVSAGEAAATATIVNTVDASSNNTGFADVIAAKASVANNLTGNNANITENSQAKQPSIYPGSAVPDAVTAKETKALDLMELVEIMRTVLNSTVGKIKGTGADIRPILQGLVKNRVILLDNLRLLAELVRSNEALIQTAAGKELLSRISDLRQQVVGQTLFNSASRLNHDALTNNYYFSFPVEIDKELHYCQLRIQKNPRKQLDRQDAVKLTVSLDTSALGIVVFHVDWHRQGFIQLQGVVENASVGGFIENNIEELLLKLRELDYSVNNLGVKTAMRPDELVLKPRINETSENAGRQFGIDIMV